MFQRQRKETHFGPSDFEKQTMQSSTADSKSLAGVTAPGDTNGKIDVNEKICQDLDSVEEKITLCHAMLRDSKGEISKSNEALLSIIGFLEACSPRMVELVQAGTSGSHNILSEDTLGKCFAVHDSLSQTLKDLDNVEKWTKDEKESSAPVAAKAAAAKETDSEDLLGLDAPPTDSASATPAVGGKTTGLNDDDDPFNAFISERAKSNNENNKTDH